MICTDEHILLWYVVSVNNECGEWCVIIIVCPQVRDRDTRTQPAPLSAPPSSGRLASALTSASTRCSALPTEVRYFCTTWYICLHIVVHCDYLSQNSILLTIVYLAFSNGCGILEYSMMWFGVYKQEKSWSVHCVQKCVNCTPSRYFFHYLTYCFSRTLWPTTL